MFFRILSRRNIWIKSMKLLFCIGTIIIVYEGFISRQSKTVPKVKEYDSFFDSLQTERKNRIADVCQKEMSKDQSLNHASGNFLFYSSLNLSYCVVAKVGCTFWISIIRFLLRDFPENLLKTHPLDLTKYNVHSASKRLKHLTKDVGYSYLVNSTKFFFARNPYSRLLSGYMDKMMLPGYWTSLSVDIVSLTRNKTNTKCVNDITFREFLHYVVVSETKNFHRNGHWIPVYKLCNPCKWKFDYIGKQETFTKDAKVILEYFGLNYMKNRSYLQNMLHQTYSQSEYTFSFANVANNICNQSIEFIARRLWYVYQMQGYIRNTSQFIMPRLEQGEKLTLVTFQKLVEHEIISNTITSLESSNQRKNFWREFFSKIPTTLIKEIQKVYELDFKLFDYSFDSYQ
ncbi:carbohydrate sulfotransferase 11 [Octopus sinensis]|uniref:Carbohydrate sulfotransferase n=1 Tax=Octopus sinensis TaxID=2607531 RepID=A0A6P7U7D1_9MOLL|nr:carbohydrate sulfotransferase 11 [Octopus sinensis]